MLKRRFTHSLVAILVLVSLLLQGTLVLAGTTGSLTGTVLDATSHAALGNAKITATSPSQTVSTTTDAGGHFTFASLAPDTYTLSVEKQGFDPSSQTGVNIFADQGQVVQINARKALTEIGRVTARSATDLVKPGTTADVYSVNALQQDKFSGVGGGGGLNNAYSAIATIPGAYVPANQSGYFQTIHIRGGDYDQVGYEVDGVPVNRSFDNYPSGTASSLGQQELQVYTGAAPANAEGQGLSGFINQVIKTGTYPGFATADLGIGGPAFYHKGSIEFGGATANRNLSYYVATGGYNQDFRYIDQFNGTSFNAYGPIAQQLTTEQVVTAPYILGNPSNLQVRDTVANVHIGIPHRGGGSKDDIQLLYLQNQIQTLFYSSPNDIGAAALGTPITSLTYPDSFQYNGQVGTFLPANAASQVSNYYFPSSSHDRLVGTPIPVNNRDSYQNSQAIFKAQYQKNFSSNAYFRLYGYTYYSDWLQNGPSSATQPMTLSAVSADYELSSHTRGVSGTFADQINAQNLIQLQGSYTTASSLRDNNTQYLNGAGRRSNFAVLVDGNNPTAGYCYTAATAGAVATATDCNTYTGAPHATTLKLGQAFAAAQPGGAPLPDYSNQTCGTGPCRFFVVENGKFATYNTVKPKFTAGSLVDTFKPSDRLLINAGIRYDLFQFEGSDTTGTPARTLFFNSYNLNNCIDASGGAHSKTALGVAPTAACSTLPGYTTPQLANVPSQVTTYPVFQPRLGFTYSLSPNSVIRASYGRYAQAPNAAFEQYNTLQQNSPYSLLGTAFYKFGFTTPTHNVRPEVSNNYDISLEHRFRGTDLSLKLTPFYRYTQDQIQTFFLDQATNFVSGLNADRLTSRGVELQVNKGDFGRDGFAAQLAFTYTNAYAQYNTFANGSNIFTGINTDIQNYNGYTAFCGTNPGDARCPKGGSPNAAACFDAGGVPAPCATGAISNPYYNAPVQSLVDPNGKYQPFSLVTGPVGASANSYLVPYVATFIFQYKKGPLAITPSVQFSGGQRYGVPESSIGLDPASGCSPLAGATGTAGDPRYPYGGAGTPVDAISCAGTLAAIPNPFTKRFDGIGDFVNPSNLLANVQLSYQATKRVQLVATFANVINNCFGGSREAWTTGGSNVCSYGLVNFGNGPPYVGNAYNPGDAISPTLQSPYQRSYGVFNTNGISTKQPFSVFFDARIKL